MFIAIWSSATDSWTIATARMPMTPNMIYCPYTDSDIPSDRASPVGDYPPYFCGFFLSFFFDIFCRATVHRGPKSGYLSNAIA